MYPTRDNMMLMEHVREFKLELKEVPLLEDAASTAVLGGRSLNVKITTHKWYMGKLGEL